MKLYSLCNNEKNMRIVFMGTPDFAVPALDILVSNNYEIAAVITAPDKPRGRGLKMQESAVKTYALQHGLKVLQPEKLKHPEFIEALQSLKADLQIVVAFRMLPEIVWSMPPLGTFNLHASLLPQYRGAAPINYAVMNGEVETGVTTFFLVHEIDTGNIILQEKCPIDANETAGELHDKLMKIGADAVLKTVQMIERNEVKTTPQEQLMNGIPKTAHKIFKDDCMIHWEKQAHAIHNFIRGLSPFPAAYTYLHLHSSEKQLFKIYRCSYVCEAHQYSPGTVESDGKTYLKVACADGFIFPEIVQVAGKKSMSVTEFLRGFNSDKILSLGN
jgi:methionyl-tRNA formyltransferase